MQLKKKKLITTLALVSMLSLTGCEHELAPEQDFDKISVEDSTITQELEVPGENFKLIVEYSRDEDSEKVWRITSSKTLHISAHTKGLPEDTLVWIDNLHMDTSIISKYASFDGIKQDEMDDHVHSSQLIGFPIGDTIFYYGKNDIEGCNETFIKGTMHGYNGYSSGSVEEKRFTEKDYLEHGVTGNKISAVFDLLIQGPNDKSPRNVSVDSDFVVNVTSNKVDIEKFNGKVKTKTIE